MDSTIGKCVYDDTKTTSDPDIRPMNEDDNNGTQFLYLIFILPLIAIGYFIRHRCSKCCEESMSRSNQRQFPNQAQDLNRRVTFVNHTSVITRSPGNTNYSQVYRVGQRTPPVPLNMDSSVPSYEDVTAIDGRPTGANVYSIETAYTSWPNYDPKDNQVIEDPPPTYEAAVASAPIDHTSSHHL
jgi:hypothetical protein